jgi:hypothetical protein
MTDGHYLPAVLLSHYAVFTHALKQEAAKIHEHVCPPQIKHFPRCIEHAFLHWRVSALICMFILGTSLDDADWEKWYYKCTTPENVNITFEWEVCVKEQTVLKHLKVVLMLLTHCSDLNWYYCLCLWYGEDNWPINW